MEGEEGERQWLGLLGKRGKLKMSLYTNQNNVISTSDASKRYRLFGGNWPIQIVYQFDRRFDRFKDGPFPGWFKWSNRIRTVINQFNMILKIMCKLFLTIRCGSIFWRKKILIWMEWFILLMISIGKWFEWKKKKTFNLSTV